MDDATIQRLQAQKEDLEEKVKASPQARAFWVQLGNVSKQLGDKERAMEAFKKALEMNPNDSFLKNTILELEGKSKKIPPMTQARPIQYTPTSADIVAAHKTSKWVFAGIGAALIIIIAVIAVSIMRIGKDNPRLIMESELNIDHPRISPDGQWVAFTETGGAVSRIAPTIIFIAPVAGGEPKKIMTEGLDVQAISSYNAVWKPDSSGFLFLVTNNRVPKYVEIKTDGSYQDVNLKVPPGYNATPSISPDGSRIAYVARNEDTYGNSLIIGYLDSGDATRIFDYNNIFGLAWSPDGASLAFCVSKYDSEEGENRSSLMVIRPDGSGNVTVDEADYRCNPVFFGAQDTRLVYEKKGSLYSVPLSTLSGPEKLLPDDFDSRIDGDLTVSADLSVLAFTATVGTVQSMGGSVTVGDVFLLKEGESKPVLASKFHKGKWNPSLSPDGTIIAYEAERMALPPVVQAWIAPTALAD